MDELVVARVWEALANNVLYKVKENVATNSFQLQFGKYQPMSFEEVFVY